MVFPGHRARWIVRRPLAHRGLHDATAGRIENTLSAFRAAVDNGYAIECDLQVSGDGEAMVFHDDTLDRLTAESGPVRRRTAAQLTEIGYSGGPDCIATLPDLLGLVAGRAALVLELKSHWDGDITLARRTVECLCGYDGPVAIMSFDPVFIAWAADNAPEIVRGIVYDGAAEVEYPELSLPARLSLRGLRHAPVTRPDFLSANKHQLRAPAVSRFRRSGGPVICWTVRSVPEMSEASRWSDQITFEGFTPRST
jgi:glycerophosphoryl diester phosphodiesterase